MAYDHEEQEQLALIKGWWNQYGNLITWFLISVMAAYAGWSGWNYYQRKQTVQSSLLYEELEKSVIAKDNAKTLRAATDLQARFGSTLYAQMGAFSAAKNAFDANDIANARKQLLWVIDHGSAAEYQAIARLRLSGLLLDGKSYEEALRLLDMKFPLQFSGLVADRQGDILVSQNKNDLARTSYKFALQNTEKNSSIHQMIQMKLDALGNVSVKAAD